MHFCPLYKYKKIFGVENKGIHSIRFCNVAIIDYALSIIIAIVICIFTKFPLVLSTIVILIIGEILHILFGIKTNTTVFLGFNY